MTEKPRYLSKSRFKLGSECPRKLFYLTHKDEYANQSLDDGFLKALAEGGHQVGALAQQYFPGGILVKTLDYGESVAQTNELLLQDNVTIYEPAFLHEDYFLRVDVLVKKGAQVELIEVKAKSYDREKGFLTQKGHPYSGVESYLDDVAFQTWVVREAHPEWQVDPFLMMIDKAAVVTVDGLHQLFRITKDADGRADVHLNHQLSAEQLGREILVKIPMDDIVDRIIAGTMRDLTKVETYQGNPLEERASYLANLYRDGTRAPIKLGSHCKKCEFRNSQETQAAGKRSGFDECWTEKLGPEYSADEFHVGKLWNFRKTDGMLGKGIWKGCDVPHSDLTEPQQTQVRLSLAGSECEWWAPELKEALESWQYPLHFLDFETMSPAIPFHKGLKPYESEGFQFSCHHVAADGTITHDEYIAQKPGEYPSYEFLAALRDSLGNNDGTIFRYSPHENTILRHLRRNLIGDRPKVPASLDQSGLVDFIDSITQSTSGEPNHLGVRNMVDMYPLVINHYYHRKMGSKKSIKAVLDSIMSTSSMLKEKYSQPLGFGTNLVGMTMWQVCQDTGETADPYRLLPPIFEDVDPTAMAFFEEDEELRDGGAAMTAFAKMQFMEMGADERAGTVKALLRYCELDTLAMVMLWEHWKWRICS
jgi:Domain of unknown function(DUF2779)